ncbi:MAG: FAD binding domain-containing protein [Caldisericia bacterium]
MLKNVKECFYPKNLEECLNLLNDFKEKIDVVGGGVDIIWRDRKELEYLIFLDRLGLNFIKKDEDYIIIGAATTLDELEKIDILHDAFKKAIKSVATPILRNVMTIGGTIVRGYSWSDILTIFITLEGKVKVFDGEEKIFTIDEFLQYKKSINKKFILTELLLSNFNDSYHFSYTRFTRTSSDIPLLNEGVLLKLSNKKVEKVNIILGGRPGFPIHLKKVEENLINKELNIDLINYLKEVATNTSEVFDDMRLSMDYRKNLSGVLTKRNLIKIMEEL